MGPRSRDDKKDTGERLEAVEDEVEDLRRHRTPDMGMNMTAISETTMKAISAVVQQQCRKDGPAAEIWEVIGKMRDENVARDKLISEFLGAQKLARWLVPMVVSLASSALAVGLIKVLWGSLR